MAETTIDDLITGIEDSKEEIQSTIVAKGVAVPEGTKLAETAAYIAAIPNTTYEISRSGSNIVLTGSDGSSSTASLIHYIEHSSIINDLLSAFNSADYGYTRELNTTDIDVYNLLMSNNSLWGIHTTGSEADIFLHKTAQLYSSNILTLITSFNEIYLSVVFNLNTSLLQITGVNYENLQSALSSIANTLNNHTHSITYTPKGTISTPTITVTTNNDTASYMEVSSGTMVVTSKNVVTGIKSATSTQPVFTGTAETITSAKL